QNRFLACPREVERIVENFRNGSSTFFIILFVCRFYKQTAVFIAKFAKKTPSKYLFSTFIL
ncbi:hypothetical protein, partial [Thalassotalea sp. PP2-459]|uniref:hypothetical protein n=1 Tax=Thalassotalea sp. PP2-459 TaxID=1742724 RepID=UPI001C37A02C